jgi:predicted phosphoribosyltransferase
MTDEEAPLFHDRSDAGFQLSQVLGRWSFRQDVVVVALPRAVPVAYEVAFELQLPLDVLVLEPIVVPGPPDLTIGVASGRDVLIVDRGAVATLSVSPSAEEAAGERAGARARARELRLRSGAPAEEVGQKNVLLVDDGLTGPESLLTAAETVRCLGALKIVAALPFATLVDQERLRFGFDDVVCLTAPGGRSARECYGEPGEPDEAAIRDLLAPRARGLAA